jgi:hypothetical protein
MTEEELEEMTVQFLRENDSFYHNKKKLEHSYLSRRADKDRRSREIPVSNLSARQKQSCAKLGDSIDWE